MTTKTILIINPNTCYATAQQMSVEAQKIASANIRVKSVCLEESSIYSANKVFSYIDLAYAVVLTVRAAMKNLEETDGILIAGFSDVAVDALREMLNIPVIGIGEASCHMAAMMSHRFSILTGTEKWTPPKQDTLARHGLTNRLASLRSYSEWNSGATPEQILIALERCSRLCIDEDGAEAIVIGAGPLVGFGRALQKRIGIPVIDPTLCGYLILENCLRLGITHSKLMKWKTPPTEISDSNGDYAYNRAWMTSADKF